MAQRMKGGHGRGGWQRGTSDRSQDTVKKWELQEQEGRRLQSQYESIQSDDIGTFDALPLSAKTKTALRMSKYTVPTEIQRATIGLALQGNDILGAAKTGSGKTLAFLIPVLECLYRSRWSKSDGLGALIISPTRELAYQTFEVLCKVGNKHDFSAALIIGGKDLKTEMKRITSTNIVVCTPGRFLHHLDQTVSLECFNLQILVLDEADRILDLGFEKTMNAIFECLPSKRQTLLFSATQTKSVRDLARLSLKDPKYVAVHLHHKFSTPNKLEQNYVVCGLDLKIDLLYSFIRNHTKKKVLVFMSSCKQVKYTFDAFCSLQPGITIMALYGTLHQLRRVEIYNKFCHCDAAVLFATDIAARGLDFPAVNWVLQLDCPEDASTYIHRVGRTARYESGGESLLILIPSEEDEMVKQLEQKRIPIRKLNVNPNRKMSIQARLQSLCAGSNDLKESAKRCFISYVKSVYLMKNKKVFDVSRLPLDKYSFSLGLAVPPRVRFLERATKLRAARAATKTNKLSAKRDKTGQSLTEKLLGLNEPSTAGDIPPPGEDGSLDSLVAKLLSRQRSKDDAIRKPLSRKDELKLKAKTSVQSDQSDTASHSDGSSDQSDGTSVAGFGAGQEEEDAFLTVKTKDVFGVHDKPKPAATESTQDAKKVVQPKKWLNKGTMAKKLRRMNIQVNTRKQFDDDGRVTKQWPPVQHTVVPGDAGPTEGGIDIEKAKAWMREEDLHDKIAFRERIRGKHRTERRKAKEERGKVSRRRKDTDSEQGDDDDDDYDDDGDVGAALNLGDDYVPFDPDMLPDPGVISDETDEFIPGESTRKRTRKDGDKTAKKKRKGQPKQKGINEVKGHAPDDGLTLQDNEELALHILSNRDF